MRLFLSKHGNFCTDDGFKMCVLIMKRRVIDLAWCVSVLLRLVENDRLTSFDGPGESIYMSACVYVHTSDFLPTGDNGSLRKQSMFRDPGSLGVTTGSGQPAIISATTTTTIAAVAHKGDPGRTKKQAFNDTEQSPLYYHYSNETTEPTESGSLIGRHSVHQHSERNQLKDFIVVTATMTTTTGIPETSFPDQIDVCIVDKPN